MNILPWKPGRAMGCALVITLTLTVACWSDAPVVKTVRQQRVAQVLARAVDAAGLIPAGTDKLTVLEDILTLQLEVTDQAGSDRTMAMMRQTQDAVRLEQALHDAATQADAFKHRFGVAVTFSAQYTAVLNYLALATAQASAGNQAGMQKAVGQAVKAAQAEPDAGYQREEQANISRTQAALAQKLQDAPPAGTALRALAMADVGEAALAAGESALSVQAFRDALAQTTALTDAPARQHALEHLATAQIRAGSPDADTRWMDTLLPPLARTECLTAAAKSILGPLPE